MSELLTLVENQRKQIEQLQKSVDNLCILIMKDKVDTTWVPESVAAEMIGYNDPRTLRKLVKSGALDIDFRNTNGRKWQYSRKSIMALKEKTSTIRVPVKRPDLDESIDNFIRANYHILPVSAIADHTGLTPDKVVSIAQLLGLSRNRKTISQ